MEEAEYVFYVGQAPAKDNVGVHVMLAFHDVFSREYATSHRSVEGSLVKNVAGEMTGIPDQYMGGRHVVSDVGVNGKPQYRSPENRKEIVEAYEAWHKGGDASGTLSSGEDFDFKGEETLEIPHQEGDDADKVSR